MKKILIASTALVAASLVSTGAASASEKIKLNLGGYSKWWVVGTWQDDKFQNGDGSATAAGQKDYNNVDIKGDNEVFFGGETTLDNGLKVGINVELEAGGNTNPTGSKTDSADLIDKSSVFVEGGFGKFIIGSEANGTALLHVMAPDAAGNTDTDGILTGGWAVVAPTAAAGGHDFNARGTTAIDTDDNADKITYVAPTFYGLTVGASYVPNSKEDDRGPTKLNNNATVAAGEIFGAGALYANTFGGLGVKVSAGWVAYDVEAGVLDKTGVNEYALGSQLSYAGFTLGGSFRKINSKDSLVGTLAADATVWDAGLQYASGPYAISFVYFESKQAVTTTQDDTLSVYQVSGKYALGPGVDVLATAGHAEYESDIAGPNNNNEGWAVMTGLSLAF